MIAVNLPIGTKLQASFPLSKALVDVILTAILTPLTAGLVLFIFPYYFQRDILDHSFIVDADGKRIGSLDCTLTFPQMIKHAFPWMILSLLTFGLALLFFQVRVTVFVYNHTEVNWFDVEDLADDAVSTVQLISADEKASKTAV